MSSELRVECSLISGREKVGDELSGKAAAEPVSEGVHPALSELSLTCQNFAAELKSLNYFTSENRRYYRFALEMTPQSLWLGLKNLHFGS